MKTWMVAFGLWLARQGGWTFPVLDHADCQVELKASWAQLDDERTAYNSAVEAARKALDDSRLADAVKAAFEQSYQQAESARLATEAAMRSAIVEREQAVAALKAYTAPGIASEIYHRAKVLVTLQAGNVGVSGEAKRHQVYARLVKEFPTEPRRNLGLAIELALR